MTEIEPIANSSAPQVSLDLTVVIVNYNVRDFLEQALQSVGRASSILDTEVIVVDNNSVDGSVLMVRERFPKVQLIANDRNVGFGVANNMAIERARGRHILILNPDTIVQEDTLDRMVAFMDSHPEAGAVGCQILNPDGTFAPESRRGFPTPQVGFYRMTGLGRLFPKSRRFGRYNLSYLPRDEVAEVDALSGSCMMVRQSTLMGSDGRPGTGLFDEEFFMYGEDLDLCYRIQKAGWKIYYSPDTQIIHYKGESTKKGELRYVRLFYGAMALFTRKHLRSRYSTFFAGVLQSAIVVRAGLSLVTRALTRLRAPALDWVLVFGVVVPFGWLRSEQLGAPFSDMFVTAVGPAFGAGVVAGILATGGYRTGQRQRLRPAILGIFLGFLLISAVSFFAKSIAFSRVVVLLSLPVSLLLLSGWRIWWAGRDSEVRRAIVVGDRDEAERLAAMLRAHPKPPFLVDGFVDATQDVAAPGEQGHGVHLLGALHHLRDLVRLHRVHDVVFAVKTLSNRRILGVMQSLRDLPVQFRMLGEDHSHVIGKANISQLGLPDWSEAVSDAIALRGRASRKVFEIPLASLLFLSIPLLWLVGRDPTSETLAARLYKAALAFPAVITGRKDLVGVDPSHTDLVPGDWRLREGVFNVTQLLQQTTGNAPSEDDLTRAYWFYVTHQSTSLDAEIIFRGYADR